MIRPARFDALFGRPDRSTRVVATAPPHWGPCPPPLRARLVRLNAVLMPPRTRDDRRPDPEERDR